MTEDYYTPGPYWMAEDNNPADGTDRQVWDVGEGDECLATFNRRPDALLYRAAPDMMAALLKVEEHLDAIKYATPHLGDELDVVLLAIAKARGQDT